ncbi:MAG: hypothetical protein WDA53_02540 [Bacillota bacterium]
MYVLPWVLFITGLLLIIVFTPKAIRGLPVRRDIMETVSAAPSTVTTEDVVLDYLQSLEGEIALLKGELSNLGDQVVGKALKGEFVPRSEEAATFQKVLEGKKEFSPQLEAYKVIYQAYDQGKSVTEIAKELGKGKGEIELILGLRR